jgi:hypothetical protein
MGDLSAPARPYGQRTHWSGIEGSHRSAGYGRSRYAKSGTGHMEKNSADEWFIPFRRPGKKSYVRAGINRLEFEFGTP